MKYFLSSPIKTYLLVAPLVGAWIEIDQLKAMDGLEKVAPLVGAWIEICNPPFSSISIPVAPLVGAWIEILYILVAKSTV